MIDILIGLKKRLNEILPNYKIHLESIKLLERPEILLKIIKSSTVQYGDKGFDSTLSVDIIIYPDDFKIEKSIEIVELLDTELLPFFKGNDRFYKIGKVNDVNIRDTEIHYSCSIDYSGIKNASRKEIGYNEEIMEEIKL